MNAFFSTDANFQTVGRVVFGEARGETARGQLAVAYSIVNRINHSGYPNTLNAVVNQKTAGGAYQYETLGVAAHTKAWNVAKKGNTQEYKNAIKAAIQRHAQQTNAHMIRVLQQTLINIGRQPTKSQSDVTTLFAA